MNRNNRINMSSKIGIIPSATALVWLFAAGIFILDAWFVTESNLSFAYLLVIMLGLLFQERNDVVLLGVITTALTVAAVIVRYQNGSEAPLDQMLVARTLSVAGIWTGAYLVITILTMKRDESAQEEQFHALSDHPKVKDVRNLGVLAAVQLHARDGAPGARSTELRARCIDDGVLLRAGNDTVLISPPLTFSADEVNRVATSMRNALDAID